MTTTISFDALAVRILLSGPRTLARTTASARLAVLAGGFAGRDASSTIGECPDCGESSLQTEDEAAVCATCGCDRTSAVEKELRKIRKMAGLE